jgi:ATP-dependent DNA helicase RecQ
MDISETAERFIRYHYERFLKDGNEDLMEWKDSLVNKVDLRIKEKKKRIRYMKKWIETDTCKRAKILNEFSEDLIDNPYNCCNVCGIMIEDYTLSEKDNIYQLLNYDWEEELDLLFDQRNKHV